MIITFKIETPEDKVLELKRKIESYNIKVIDASSHDLGVFGLIGTTTNLDTDVINGFDFVIDTIKISDPFYKTKKDNKEIKPIKVNDIVFDSTKTIIIAGPCSVENENQIMETAKAIKKAGATILRGGIFKPRTSPYVFQGLGTDAISMIEKVKKETALPFVSEAMSIKQIDDLKDIVDIYQVGARNMQNFELLKALGKVDKPVILKRGFGNTIEEWLMSAEYIIANGNPNVILCERGIRTFETMTRNTLDLSVIAIIKQKTNLPIIIDPSHATGHWELVEGVSLAAIAAGADGLMIEVHNAPEHALSDGGESLRIDKFEKLMNKAKKLAEFMNKPI